MTPVPGRAACLIEAFKRREVHLRACRAAIVCAKRPPLLCDGAGLEGEGGRDVRRACGRWLSIGALAALVIIGATPASAQSRSFNVPAQSAQRAVSIFARQAGVQILAEETTTQGVGTHALVGTLSVEDGLDRLLRDTPLDWRSTGPRSFAIIVRAADAPAPIPVALPEIVVLGRRDVTFNTAIRRTQDDSQPFVVIEGDAIRKSGATDMETFLRNALSVAASRTTAEQVGGLRNRTTVNLRGLGERETLILIDGRRLPGVTNLDGSLGQPNIAGIPIAAVERVEVLASSASAIYGSGATGGAVNIIMRRDYSGGEISTTLSDTLAGGGAGRRVDVLAGRAFEDGRSRVSFAANWAQSDSLREQDRHDLLAEDRREDFARDPQIFRYFTPLGRTPNIRSLDGSPLTLDRAYGGRSLGSTHTFAPEGYRGVAIDGPAPLVANAGRYALDWPEDGPHDLVHSSRRLSLSLSARRDMTAWLRVYADVWWMHADSGAANSVNPTYVILDGDAPNNPFAQDVHVAVPFSGAALGRNHDRAETHTGILGAVARLPRGWHLVLDVSYGRHSRRSDDLPAELSQTTLAGISRGTVDVLKDLRVGPPFPYVYEDVPYGFHTSPNQNDLWTTSVRAGGALPFRLPGGDPTATLSLERVIQHQSEAVIGVNASGYGYAELTWPGREQIDSVYGEVNLPFATHLLLTVSARYERYDQTGRPIRPCFLESNPLPTLDIRALCPASAVFPVKRSDHLDPSVSLRWRPTRGVTVRSAYATGYLTPRFVDLLRTAYPRLATTAVDRRRSDTPIGTLDAYCGCYYGLPGFGGGNVDIRPETSQTWTGGLIFEPDAVKGLRLSLDWTRIVKRDNHYDPMALLFPDGDPTVQAAFDAFLARYPERATRGSPSDGFDIGPITALDVSLANLVGSVTEAIDLTAQYSRPFLGGQLAFRATATYVDKHRLQEVPGGPSVDFAGAYGDGYESLQRGFGALRWKGGARLDWTGDHWSLGWQMTAFGAYVAIADEVRTLFDERAEFADQTYHDLFARYAFETGATLSASITNLFSAVPPRDHQAPQNHYSGFGDLRLATYALTLTKAF